MNEMVHATSGHEQWYILLFIGCPPNPNIKVVYRDNSRYISGGAKREGHYACVAGSDVTRNGPDRKWRYKIKGIAQVFNWCKCLGGIMHLRPTAGCQISTLIFEKNIVEGVSINIPIGFPPNPNIKVVYRDSSRHISGGAKGSGPLRMRYWKRGHRKGTWLKWPHSRKYVLRTLYIFHVKLPKDGKVLCHSGLSSKVLPGTLTDLSA
jgi:hypothetical protein